MKLNKLYNQRELEDAEPDDEDGNTVEYEAKELAFDIVSMQGLFTANNSVALYSGRFPLKALHSRSSPISRLQKRSLTSLNFSYQQVHVAAGLRLFCSIRWYVDGSESVHLICPG